MPSPEPSVNSISTPTASTATRIDNPLRDTPEVQSHATAPSYRQEPNGGLEQIHKQPLDRQDAILEGKQKAKAALAAADASLSRSADGSKSSSRAGSKSPFPATADVSATNGQLSRKRSRSGSRKPNTPPAAIQPAKPRPTYEQLTLAQSIARSQVAAAALNDQAEHRSDLSRTEPPLGTINRERDLWRQLRTLYPPDPGQVLYGRGFEGYGNGWTMKFPQEHGNRIRYPMARKRPGNRETPELRIPRKDRELQADQQEELVPIRLDIDLEKLRLRDTFTWNIHDRVIPPELFARGLVEDFQIPPEYRHVVTQQVHQALTEQISDYHPHAYMDYGPLDPHLPYSAYKNDDMRILIKLNITIGQHTLVDQFDWDINNTLNSAEEFAMRMARDLSLSGEFMTAIAHSIREQSQIFTKSLYIAGHPFDGRPIEDPDVRENMLPSPLLSVFRTFQGAKDFAPSFYELNEVDLEKAELAFNREQRQQKRSVNRRGGPSLPDLKERLRTSRTMVVSTVVPGAAENEEESGVFKRPRIPAGIIGPGRGRRATRGEIAGDSDLSESDDSDGESPTRAQALTGGTARTRGIRSAASLAQAAMRSSHNRSATPESLSHHHETRTSARRLGGYDTREDSVHDGDRLIVKLKISKAKLKQWEPESSSRRQRGSHHHQRQSSVVSQQRGSPHPGSLTPGPPSHVAFPSTSTPNNRFGTPGQRGQSGDPMSTGTPPTSGPSGSAPSGPAPAPPTWLTSALPPLRLEYPNDSFEATMRWSHQKGEWQPRLRCNDCTGILYNTVPNDPLSNFRVHLKHGKHRDRVNTRLSR